MIRLLIDNGDDITVARRVDHLSIFKTKQAAQSFSDWAKSAGYEVDPIWKEGALFKKAFHVETHNVTGLTVYDINPHSLGHFRKATELGGEYDGWGTTIVSKD